MTQRLLAARLRLAARPTGRPCGVPDMPAATTSARAPRAASPWWCAIVAGLLAAYAVMAWTASLAKGVSFDEGVQLAVGYNEWLRGDFRIEGANGDLVKRWATLPFLISRPHFLSPYDPLWQRADSYEFGRRFLFELGNAPDALLAQARAMVTLLGVATDLLVLACSRALFGRSGALVSLALFAFSPHMLAFGGIVSTDMSVILMLPASTWCIWRLLHEVTVTRVIASAGCCGLLLLAKMTAVVIFPITAVLIAVRFAANPPLIVRWRTKSWELRRRRPQAMLALALVICHALAGWAAIWAHYDFRYSATPPGYGLAAALPPPSYADGRPGPAAAVVQFTREHRLLPEGYCHGVEWLLGSDDKLPAFMRGQIKLGGWRAFFPYAIWVKTHPTLFALVAFGGWAWWRARRNPVAGAAGADGDPPSFYAATPFVTLIGVYLAVAVTENINLGHRHVLPIYPALYVLAGSVVLGWRRHAARA